MKRLLWYMASLLAFTCAMRSWQFYLPPRVLIYDLLSLAFIGVWVLYYLTKPARMSLNKDLVLFLLLTWLYFVIQMFSGIKLFNASSESFDQFFKAMLTNGTFAVFATCFCLFLSGLQPGERNRILAFFIAGVFFSSLYGVAGTILYRARGIRIEQVWNYVSYNVGGRYDESISWAVLGIRRGVGFPGVNASATYNMTILPLLLLCVFYRGRLKDYLVFFVCFAGLVVTLSRTGFVGFTVSMVVLTVMNFKGIVERARFRLFLVTLPFLLLAYLWRDTIAEILVYRPLNDPSRLMIWKSGLRLFFDDPVLGVGINNFSVARQTLGSGYYHLPNLHNSWLTILVELGIVGFVFYMVFMAFVLLRALRKSGILAKGVISAIVGLSAAGLANQVFDLFYFKFFMTLAFSMLVLNDGRLFCAKRKRRRGSDPSGLQCNP